MLHEKTVTCIYEKYNTKYGKFNAKFKDLLDNQVHCVCKKEK